MTLHNPARSCCCTMFTVQFILKDYTLDAYADLPPPPAGSTPTTIVAVRVLQAEQRRAGGLCGVACRRASALISQTAGPPSNSCWWTASPCRGRLS